jgi:hypothetical protein
VTWRHELRAWRSGTAVPDNDSTLRGNPASREALRRILVYHAYEESAAAMAILRHRRAVAAIAAVVAFNLVMFVLAAIHQGPMEAPFLVVWITGDAVVSLAALALTEGS